MKAPGPGAPGSPESASPEDDGGIEVHVNRLDACREAGVPHVGTSGETEALGGLLARASRRVLREVGESRGEVSLTLVSPEEIARLHLEYLGRSGPTDVIAFRLADEPLLGDVYLCPEMAVRAAESGEALDAREELIRLAVHGTLHVAGRDHPEGEERWSSPMYRLQEEIVADLLGSGGTG